jgi:hypothetical protein
MGEVKGDRDDVGMSRSASQLLDTRAADITTNIGI